jgi:transcriptional antiterminator
MDLIDGKIKLTELAARFNVTPQALRNHIKNKNTSLGTDAVKLNDKQTGDFLLSIDSVLKFITWLKSNGRRVNYGTLEKIEKEIKCLMQ